MNNSEYNQLLAELILMPFVDVKLNCDDWLCSYARAYKQLVCGDKFSGEPTHSELKKTFERSKRKILYQFASDPRWKHLDDVQMLLDAFYPGYKLMEFYNEQSNDLGKFYLNHIFNVARTFITFRDGIVSVRSWSDDEECLLYNYEGLLKIELWNNITRTIPPDLFIAAAYLNFSVEDADALVNVPNLVMLADIPLSKIFKKGVAETHLHMNVGFSYSYVWRCCVELFGYNKKPELWFCTLFRIYSAIYIEAGTTQSFQSFISDPGNDPKLLFKFYTKLVADVNSGHLPQEANHYCPSHDDAVECEKALKSLYLYENNDTHDILFNTVYSRYSQNGSSSEIIWYFKLLDFLRKRYDKELCGEFLTYIRFRSSFFSDKIQQNKIGGLNYFHDFYLRAADPLYNIRPVSSDIQEEAYYSIFEEQCRTGNLEVLEIKITPRVETTTKTDLSCIETMKSKSLIQIQKIVKSYQKYIITNTRNSNAPEKLRFPKLGIIYHFIKQNDCDNFSGYNCISSDIGDELDCKDYRTMQMFNIRFYEAFKQLIKQYPLLSKYIVGIDAASIENSAEPWVFAPVFKAFRSSTYVLPTAIRTGERISNVGFTYHVGEDFRHIASGLRHIDEVLTHFNYCSGDRLGHAIALGVDIDKLLSQNKIVVLPIMEHLENLLWIWSKSASGSSQLKAPQNIEYMIMDVAEKIYSCIDGINVYTLWQVYNDKFKMPDSDMVKNMRRDGRCILMTRQPDGSLVQGTWDREKLLCTHYCPCYFEQYNRPIFVRITDEEIGLYKELQMALREKVENLGIYVETNPSSNTVIGDIDGIFSHSILNLNNKGLELGSGFDSCVMTSINSDDPMIFSTCVENEIAYIYYGLLNAGCKRENVLEWIDKIRMHGINSSFVKYDKTWMEMLDDFQEILTYSV